MKCTRTIDNAHSLNISAIDIGKDDLNIYSGSRDCSVKVWDSETGVCKSEFTASRNIVTSLKYERARNGQLFQGSEDLCVRVWDTKSNSRQPCMHITAFVYFPTCLDIQSGGNYLATGSFIQIRTHCYSSRLSLSLSRRPLFMRTRFCSKAV